MKLTQSRAVPIVLIAAIIAAVIATFAFRGGFVFGHQDPPGCNVPTTGMSIDASDNEGRAITQVSHGTEVFFRVFLSIPELPSGETACNFSGGQLSIELPNGEITQLAGVAGTPEIPLVEPGAVYVSPAASYTVDQADAMNSVLPIGATYSGGTSHRFAEGIEHPPAEDQQATNILMIPPRVEIDITPDEQVIYEGGAADFQITVTNTGGFQLSSLQIVDTLETDCERTIDSLAVGGSAFFDCQMAPAEAGDNDATVVAAVIGGVPEDQSSVRDTDTATIAIEAISISIDMTPKLQRVRVGNESTFEVTVLNPNTTAVENVTVSVPEATDCERTIGGMEAGARRVYPCTSEHPSGTVTVRATTQGNIVDVGTVTDFVEVEVVVFELDLVIDKNPPEQTIREGDKAEFTITVSNFGNTPLSNVLVSDDIAPDCSRSLGTLASQEERVFKCSSGPLAENTDSVVTVTGTAPDGDPVQDRDTVQIEVIHPQTIVAISELDTMVLKLVVQVLTITESNTGDTPLNGVYVDVEPVNVRLTADSKEFVGGDLQNDGVLDPGETWEWRLVTISVAGDHVVLAGDASAVSYRATGHGIDPLGGDITFPAYATELHTLEVPFGAPTAPAMVATPEEGSMISMDESSTTEGPSLPSTEG